ncbi:MAG: transcription elongation factor Spt5 [Nanoarchaeota archaeon]|nr:transcription elongation factor Spt5 [Nanoarchaeota archaeon]MBU1321998.1 transcription elongation factor Spt5 [Nanoarchaeota archaeon]MBU1597972.1 transcription elongation factor Spt5 [Nanoarchaeota archaeon]MBU2442336.1 transcription elongation factor Spt5 [Nanoarchaeota archaeon]
MTEEKQDKIEEQEATTEAKASEHPEKQDTKEEKVEEVTEESPKEAESTEETEEKAPAKEEVEVKEEPVVEEVPAEEPVKEETPEEPEDEYMAMMEEEAKEKEAADDEEIKEETEIGDAISLIKIKGARTLTEVKEEKQKEEKLDEEVTEEDEKPEDGKEPKIFALRTTANREDQVMDFVSSNAARKKLEVYSIIRPHGMRGYIFLEAASRSDAEQAAFGVPYARGILPSIIQYKEIEHMLEQVKKEVNIQKNDIAEIISGPFKREKCKITRIDRSKEEVVVELLEAAVPIPITVKMDAVRVIRREKDDPEDK